MKPRATWAEYAIDLAHTAATRSEDPYHKVGACALDHNYRVLGLGYNGLASGKDVTEEFWEDRDERRAYMIHAETNCLSLFKAGECALLGVTLLPCAACATIIAAYKIPEVVYSEIYARDKLAFEIFNFYGIKLTQI